MKKAILTMAILFSILLVHAQNTPQPIDSANKQTALAVCGCLEKKNIQAVQTEEAMQEIFLKCITDSAYGVFNDLLTADDIDKKGEEIGKQIALNLFNVGCDAFLKMSLTLANTKKNNGGGNESKIPLAQLPL